MAKSIGSEKFSRVPGKASQVALKLSTTLPNVSKWASGKQKPLQGMRELIAEVWPDVGPNPEEWDIPLEAEDDDSEPAAEIPIERATAQVVEAEADTWLRDLRQARAEAALKSDVGERLQLLESGARTLLTLGKMTGAGLNLTEAKILASPQWRNIEQVITMTLEPWPEAMRAVAESLKRLAGITWTPTSVRTE